MWFSPKGKFDLEKSLNKNLEITGDTDTVTVTHPDFLIRWDNFAVSEIFSFNERIQNTFMKFIKDKRTTGQLPA